MTCKLDLEASEWDSSPFWWGISVRQYWHSPLRTTFSTVYLTLPAGCHLSKRSQTELLFLPTKPRSSHLLRLKFLEPSLIPLLSFPAHCRIKTCHFYPFSSPSLLPIPLQPMSVSSLDRFKSPLLSFCYPPPNTISINELEALLTI